MNRFKFTEQIHKGLENKITPYDWRAGGNYPRADSPLLCVNVKLGLMNTPTADQCWELVDDAEGLDFEKFQAWYREQEAGFFQEVFDQAVEDAKHGADAQLKEAGFEIGFAGRSQGWLCFVEITANEFDKLSSHDRQVLTAAIAFVNAEHEDAVMECWEHQINENFRVYTKQQKDEARDKRIRALAREQLEGRRVYFEVDILDDDAQISEGDDNGAYVSVCLWVDFSGTEFDKEKGDEDAQDKNEGE